MYELYRKMDELGQVIGEPLWGIIVFSLLAFFIWASYKSVCRFVTAIVEEVLEKKR